MTAVFSELWTVLWTLDYLHYVEVEHAYMFFYTWLYMVIEYE